MLDAAQIEGGSGDAEHLQPGFPDQGQYFLKEGIEICQDSLPFRLTQGNQLYTVVTMAEA